MPTNEEIMKGLNYAVQTLNTSKQATLEQINIIDKDLLINNDSEFIEKKFGAAMAEAMGLKPGNSTTQEFQKMIMNKVKLTPEEVAKRNENRTLLTNIVQSIDYLFTIVNDYLELNKASTTKQETATITPTTPQ